MCEASPGIVTGANSEFILTKEQVETLECQKFILSTISRSNMLNGKFILTQDMVQNLSDQGNRIYLLNLAQVEEEFFSQSLKDYLVEIGDKENAEGIKLKNRYYRLQYASESNI